MKLPWRRDKGAKAPSEQAEKAEKAEKEHQDPSGAGVAQAFGFTDVFRDPDRPDDGSRYEDRSDGELHWAETEPDKPGPMP